MNESTVSQFNNIYNTVFLNPHALGIRLLCHTVNKQPKTWSMTTIINKYLLFCNNEKKHNIICIIIALSFSHNVLHYFPLNSILQV